MNLHIFRFLIVFLHFVFHFDNFEKHYFIISSIICSVYFYTIYPVNFTYLNFWQGPCIIYYIYIYITFELFKRKKKNRRMQKGIGATMCKIKIKIKITSWLGNALLRTSYASWSRLSSPNLGAMIPPFAM